MLVLLIDDHPLLRQALRDVIKAHFPLSTVLEAFNGEEAIQLVKAQPVDVVILDIFLPDCSGLTVLKRIRQVRSSIKCLVLSMHDNRQYVQLAMAQGAAGYLTKGTTAEELVEAIRAILAGREVITASLDSIRIPRLPSQESAWPHESLSVRELEVLSLLARGRTVSQAATRLKLSVKTVSTYRSRVLDKLRLGTTAELIRYAVEHRLV